MAAEPAARPALRRWLPRGVVLAVVAGLMLFGWRARDRFTPVAAGALAPAYAAPSLRGDTVSLAALRGRVVLLNVWATWCAPCLREMPAMHRLQAALRDDGLEVVAVSVDAVAPGPDRLERARARVGAYVDELGVDFTVLLDPAGEVQRLFGVTGLPTTFLIDRDGRIAAKVLGAVDWDEPPHLDRVQRLLED
jgi:peroxiredoxin